MQFEMDKDFSRTPKTPHYHNKLQQFYRQRVKDNWKGANILFGRKPDHRSILLNSNDYLQFATHPELLQTHSDALFLLAHDPLTHDPLFSKVHLEGRFSRYLKAEQTILCQSGWCANIGLLQSIVDPGNYVYIDERAHMSLWQGIETAGGVAISFRHNDVEHLQTLMRQHGPGLVAVDALYSTTGRLCRLKDIIELCEQYECISLVDESHSLGTRGENGAGLAVELGLEDRVHFRTASLAKTFAGRAGIITCPSNFKDYFQFTSFPAIFSSSLLPHDIAVFQHTLKLISGADEQRHKLHQNAMLLRSELRSIGYNIASCDAQIIPLVTGSEEKAIELRDELESRNIFASIFCAPATPSDQALLRLSIHNKLEQEQLTHIVESCERALNKTKQRNWIKQEPHRESLQYA